MTSAYFLTPRDSIATPICGVLAKQSQQMASSLAPFRAAVPEHPPLPAAPREASGIVFESSKTRTET